MTRHLAELAKRSPSYKTNCRRRYAAVMPGPCCPVERSTAVITDGRPDAAGTASLVEALPVDPPPSTRREISGPTLSGGRWSRSVLMLQPVVFSIQRDTASAANTMVRCASIDSRVWWKPGGWPGRFWTFGKAFRPAAACCRRRSPWSDVGRVPGGRSAYEPIAAPRGRSAEMVPTGTAAAGCGECDCPVSTVQAGVSR